MIIEERWIGHGVVRFHLYRDALFRELEDDESCVVVLSARTDTLTAPANPISFQTKRRPATVPGDPVNW